MRDLLEEVFIAMKNNRRRIALTGFSIGWGIFILLVLLGAGNGLVNGTKQSLGAMTDNLLTVTGGRTIIAYEGMPKGRPIHFDDRDIEHLKTTFPQHVARVFPEVSVVQSVWHGAHKMVTTVSGFEPDYMKREKVTLIAGRDLSQLDLDQRSKVCVISKRTCELLFPKGESPIGKWINIGDAATFMVVGVYKFDNNLTNTQKVFAPLTTVRGLYMPDGHYSQLRIELKNVADMEQGKALQDRIVSLLARRHHCAPGDRGAIPVSNIFDKAAQALTAIEGIQVFIWLIGIATLLAGIVGVTNIMLITVKERTRELGVRKAMGASRLQIISMVILESVFITLIFGYIGMMLGVGLTNLLDYLLVTSGAEVGFVNPKVDFQTIMLAGLVMVAAGIVAGYVPARRAVSIKLVSALTGG